MFSFHVSNDNLTTCLSHIVMSKTEKIKYYLVFIRKQKRVNLIKTSYTHQMDFYSVCTQFYLKSNIIGIYSYIGMLKCFISK